MIKIFFTLALLIFSAESWSSPASSIIKRIAKKNIDTTLQYSDDASLRFTAANRHYGPFSDGYRFSEPNLKHNIYRYDNRSIINNNLFRKRVHEGLFESYQIRYPPYEIVPLDETVYKVQWRTPFKITPIKKSTQCSRLDARNFVESKIHEAMTLHRIYELHGDVSEYLIKRIFIETINQNIIPHLAVDKFKVEIHVNADTLNVDSASLEIFSACGYSMKLSSSGSLSITGPWIKASDPVDI